MSHQIFLLSFSIMATRRRKDRKTARRTVRNNARDNSRRTKRAKPQAQRTRKHRRARTLKKPKRARFLKSLYHSGKSTAKKVAKRLPEIGMAMGVAYAGKKLIDGADRVDELRTDLMEAQDTAQHVREQLDAVSGVRSGTHAARHIHQEVKEAKQYRDTRIDAKKRGIKMDPRSKYRAEAEASAKEQAAEVNLVGKAKCFADASKLKPKKRDKAVEKCNEKYP